MTNDSLSDTNPVNCPHGVAMDIYCEKCEMYNPPLTAEKLLAIRKNMPKPESVGTTHASKRISVYEKEIWNAAIEAAAIEAHVIISDKETGTVTAACIRTLKK